jgi:hypothetical protein
MHGCSEPKTTAVWVSWCAQLQCTSVCKVWLQGLGTAEILQAGMLRRVLWLPLQVQYVWFMLLYCAYMAVLLAIGSAVNIGFFRKNSYGLQIVSFSVLVPAVMVLRLMPSRSLVDKPQAAHPAEVLSACSARPTTAHSHLTLSDPCTAPQVFYFVWGNCLVAFGFVISTFFRVVKNAVVFGYIYTIGSGAPKHLHAGNQSLTAC